jgi:hypothetical protein
MIKKTTEKKLLVLFEIGSDYMISELVDSLAKQYPFVKTYTFHGLFKNYVPGGLNLTRLINLFYMYISLPFVLLYLQPNNILVRTSPPGFQCWTVFLAKAINCKVGCWLMDYHPEIEARMLDRFSCLHFLSMGLRFVDHLFMRKMHFIIAIDHSMNDLLKLRFKSVPIILHPTWIEKKTSKYIMEYPYNTEICRKGEVRIIYAGNLGSLHPLETFEKLIRVLKNKAKVVIYTVGLSSEGLERFKRTTTNLGVESIHVKKIKDFYGLGRFIHENLLNFGLITLQDWAGGLVSPSKYNGYISFGLPLLYIGPVGTNSFEICSKYKAGLALPNSASTTSLNRAARTLADREWALAASKNTAKARAYFERHNADSLAHNLCLNFNWRLVYKKN